MKAKGVRLHAANDLRLEEFELPEITDDEILVKVVSDSICMSTYKCAILGTEHKRVHEDVAEHPAIMGHEFAGDIVKVGKNHQDQFKPGMKFTLQPALNYKGTMWSPGYSYEFFGGDATYCVIPAEVMELGCLLEYKGRAYYEASLAEPMSCSIGAFHAAYHTQMGVYTHEMGIKENGKLAIMAGAGPMGLGALTYALHRDVRPSMVVVTDINQDRLDRAEELFPVADYKKEGIDLHFVNTGNYKTGKQIATLAKFYAKLIKDTCGTDFDAMFGPAYKGIPLVAAVAVSLAAKGRNVPFAYNRKEAKDHGEGGVIVGAPLKGKVVIIDDVISAGTSVNESVGIIRQAGATPGVVLIALDRMERSGKDDALSELSAVQEVQKAHGMPVLSIANLDDLLGYLEKAGTTEELERYKNAVKAYRDRYGASR